MKQVQTALLGTAAGRLLMRALLAGVGAFTASVQSSDGDDLRSIYIGAITTGAWAAIEYLTPINASIGAKLRVVAKKKKRR